MHDTNKIRFEYAPPGHLGTHRCAVTHRTGGASSPPFESLNLGRWTSDLSSNVQSNERHVLAALGLPELVAKIELIHGSDILSVSDPGLHGKADGLVACRQDLVLTLTVADCYPVAIVTVAEKVLLHCGWRGVAANILEKAFDRLGGRSTSRDMRVWIGPGIGPECYPVGSDVSANFPESLIEDRGTIKFDLCSEIERRLESQGLDRSQIKSSGLCTACHPEIFFSHRRDGFPSGRMAAFLW